MAQTAPVANWLLGKHLLLGRPISAITLSELHEGVERSTDPARALAALGAFLASVLVLTVESQTARVFGEVSVGGLAFEGRRPSSTPP